MAPITTQLNISPFDQPEGNNIPNRPVLTVLDLKHNIITIAHGPILNHKLQSSISPNPSPQYQITLPELPPVLLAPYNSHKSRLPTLTRTNRPTLSLSLLSLTLPTYDQTTSLSPSLYPFHAYQNNKSTSIGQWTLDSNCLTWTRRLHHHGSGTMITSHGWTRSVGGDAFYRRRRRRTSTPRNSWQWGEKGWIEGTGKEEERGGRVGEDVECIYGLTSKAGGEGYICCQFRQSAHQHRDGEGAGVVIWAEEDEEGDMGRREEGEECNLPTIIALVAKHRFAYSCDCDWWGLAGRKQFINGFVDSAMRKRGIGQESQCCADEEVQREREREALGAMWFTSRRPCGSLAFWNGSRRIKAEIRKHDQICGCGCFGSERER